jgi:hypothetical protein
MGLSRLSSPLQPPSEGRPKGSSGPGEGDPMKPQRTIVV